MQEGNDQVLQQQRDEDPENEDKWTLRWHKGYAKGRARGAVYNISQVGPSCYQCVPNVSFLIAAVHIRGIGREVRLNPRTDVREGRGDS